MDGGVAVGRSVATSELPDVWRAGTTGGTWSGDPGTRPTGSATARSAGTWRATDAGDSAGTTVPVPMRREHDGGSARNAISPVVHGVGYWMGAGAFWHCPTFGVCGQGANEPLDNPGEEGGRGMGDFATVGSGGPNGPTLPVRACLAKRFHGAASGRARGDDTGGARATDNAGQRNHRARVRGSGAGLVMAIVGRETRG